MRYNLQSSSRPRMHNELLALLNKKNATLNLREQKKEKATRQMCSLGHQLRLCEGFLTIIKEDSIASVPSTANSFVQPTAHGCMLC